ncbi:MAG: zf-HC2 domain-containing protein [Acidobacteriota bacterium]
MSFFNRHITNKLSAYCDNELTPRETDQVAAHLSTCQYCQREYDNIRLGVELAREIKDSQVSPLSWQEMHSLLVAKPLNRQDLSYWWMWISKRSRAITVISLLAIITIVMAPVWYYYLRPAKIDLMPAPIELNSLETIARNLHIKQLRGELIPDYTTDSAIALRQWVKQQTGLDIEMYVNHLAAGSPNIQLQGVKLIPMAGEQAVCIAYRLNSIPVTLIATRARNVDHLPEEELFSKHIIYRLDSVTGFKLLTWKRKAQAYVIASNLPVFGQQACFVCHTNPERRQLIEGMQLNRRY